MGENIVGKNIGIYEVLYECNHRANDGHKLYHVRCSKCGYETNKLKSELFKKEENKVCRHKTVYGAYIQYHMRWQNKRIGRIYSGIKTRCYNKNDKAYRWYGAKGIKLCEEWIKEPLAFEKWSLENGYQDQLTIDRIDEKEDYCPENCRWIKLLDNSKYKSTTHIIVVDGVSHTGREWAEVLDLGTNTINKMFRENEEAQVIEFIRRRQNDKTRKRRSKQTWFSVYDIV